MFIKPQNGPTPLGKCDIKPHIVLHEAPPTFIHHFTPKGITFPFEFFNLNAWPIIVSWVSIQLKLHQLANM
jgi:hypothetical protein